jgi:hypothetical protein
MIALVDDEFNVYFVEETDEGGGIIVEGGEIVAINAKMINHPSAPKKRFTKEDKTVYRNFTAKSDKAADTSKLDNPDNEDETSGELLVKAQANASYLSGLVPSTNEYLPKSKNDLALSASWTAFEAAELEDPSFSGGFQDSATISWTNSNDSDDFSGYQTMNIYDVLTGDAADDPQITTEEANGVPFPEVGFAYDFGSGGSKEKRDLGNSLDSIKVFDFPRLYIVDVRQCAQDIAAACGASGPMELLLDLPGFASPDVLEGSIGAAKECVQEFLDFFTSKEIGEDGNEIGYIPYTQSLLAQGILPGPPSIPTAIQKFKDLEKCVKEQIDTMCEFVINPLHKSRARRACNTY